MITLYKFYSPSCAPCKMVSLFLEGIFDRYSNIDLIKIDATQECNKELVAKYSITNVPVLVLDNGTPPLSGAQSKGKIYNWLEAHGAVLND